MAQRGPESRPAVGAQFPDETPFRAAQLGLTIVYQGVSSKAEAFGRILAAEHVTDAEVAYMGDDIVDLAVLARAGLSAAPADAVPEVRQRVDWTSNAKAGSGAARELVELILKTQGRWDGIVAAYANEGGTPTP